MSDSNNYNYNYDYNYDYSSYTYQSQVTTNSNQPNASLYEGVQNVTINGGTHTNAGRNIIDIQSSGNYDAARVQKVIDRAGRLTDKYGKNASAHAYTGYRDGTINVDRVENTAGGKFTIDLSNSGSSKLDTSAEDWDDDDRQEDSDEDKLDHLSDPQYSAGAFNYAQGHQTVETILNSALGDVKIDSNTGFTVAKAILKTNKKYTSKADAQFMQGNKAGDTKMKSARNLAGLGDFDARGW